MLYMIGYKFFDENLVDDEFIDTLRTIGTLHLSFDHFALLEASFTAKGVSGLIAPFFKCELDNYIVVEITKNSAGKLSRRDKEFVEMFWSDIKKHMLSTK